MIGIEGYLYEPEKADYPNVNQSGGDSIRKISRADPCNSNLCKNLGITNMLDYN